MIHPDGLFFLVLDRDGIYLHYLTQYIRALYQLGRLREAKDLAVAIVSSTLGERMIKSLILSFEQPSIPSSFIHSPHLLLPGADLSSGDVLESSCQ